MSALDTLLKFLTEKNIAERIDEDTLNEIGKDVIKGTKIDDDSRSEWLRINREAVKILNNCDDDRKDGEGLYEGQSNVIYPLLAPAQIQLAARIITHIVRNDKVVEFKVLGKDHPMVDPQSGQPIPGMYVKAEKARKVEQYENWDMLIRSDTYLKDMHKLAHIVSGWGVGFKQIYYDFVNGYICEEIIPPEDIIVNQNITCLEKAPRVTKVHRYSKNQIIELVRSGYWLDKDLDSKNKEKREQAEGQLHPDKDYNDSNEEQPVYKFFCQTTYLDLDKDGYMEPYHVYVHEDSEEVWSIYPAFEFDDIKYDDNGKIQRIKRRLDVVDYHCLDDSEGGFYGYGLNALLLHPNKVLTTLERQLVDAGLLANAAGVSGFTTGAFKTKEKSIKVQLGRFPVLECNPNVNPQEQFIQLPFKEPSQVLLNLFQILVDASKNQGFINDFLSGDVEMQNVPATTVLAVSENATRGFKPIIQKLYISQKQAFKMRFHLRAKYMSKEEYVRFHDDEFLINQSDFDEESLDICPVADPTLSSDSVKYARSRALLEGVQIFPDVTNRQEAAVRYYTDMGFTDAFKLVAQQPEKPDPKMMEVQLKAQIEQQKIQLETYRIKIEEAELQNKQTQMILKAMQQDVRSKDSAMKRIKTQADIVTQERQTEIQQQHADIAEEKVAVEREQVEVDKIAARNQSKGD